jgi:hypothetical protein
MCACLLGLGRTGYVGGLGNEESTEMESIYRWRMEPLGRLLFLQNRRGHLGQSDHQKWLTCAIYVAKAL